MAALAHTAGHRAANYLKTAALMAALTALALVVGNAIGGARGLTLAAVLVGAMNFGSYWWSDKVALALNGARPLAPGQLPEVERIVAELAQRAQIPMPRLYVVPTESPNAFATGRNPQHAAVAVTAGILRILDERELRGVLAHELSHVVNRDTLISTIAGTLAGVISFAARSLFWFGGVMLGGGDDQRRRNPLAEFGVMLVAPIVALLLQMAVSRSREYGADASGAQLCDDPESLASALEKLERGVQRIPDVASPATSHLFIVNPLSGSSLRHLFSTHPPTIERVRRLLAMAR